MPGTLSPRSSATCGTPLPHPDTTSTPINLNTHPSMTVKTHQYTMPLSPLLKRLCHIVYNCARFVMDRCRFTSAWEAA
ncbi:MAG: hypothetical protein J2P37_01100, partial [Ktedonobacteraceae bacterium]|nr:hypothetical protein [Ktedonobacteraceae bacterium]